VFSAAIYPSYSYKSASAVSKEVLNSVNSDYLVFFSSMRSSFSDLESSIAASIVVIYSFNYPKVVVHSASFYSFASAAEVYS